MKLAKNLTTGAMVNTLTSHLITSNNVVATPRLIVDWNWNRYATNVYAENIFRNKDFGFEAEVFPIDSIKEPLRPGKGALKARVNQATVASGTWNDPLEPKFYLGSPDDVYKYWTSPYETDASGNFPTDVTLGSYCQPYVIYDAPVSANKIIIRMDNTFASPKNYSVQIGTTLVAGPDTALPKTVASWSTVGGSNPTYNTASGVLTLYFNGAGWVTTKPATLVTTTIAGIKLTVGGLQGGIKRSGQPMKVKSTTNKSVTANGWTWTNAQQGGNVVEATTNGSFASFNLISIEAHTEIDLSSRLMGVSDEFDFGESSQIYPVGTITSNQGSVKLDNTDGVFDYENSGSPYYLLMQPNAEFNLEYIYTVSGTQYSVQQFKLYSNDWQVSDDATVSIQLDDYSKFLKLIKPNKMMYENNPVTQCIWRVLDSVGFTDYQVQVDDTTLDHKIPVFWTDGEQTVWEVLDDLAQATQTAIYFDGYGQLQVKVRDNMFNTENGLTSLAASPTWTLRGQDSGGNLADIISLDQTQEFEANQVNVTYKTTKWKVGTDGNPAMSIVWEPEGDLVVRSSRLTSNITSSSTYFTVSQSEVAVWPYTSVVSIDGELIRYNGKFGVFFNADGVSYFTAWVKSQEEYDRYNDSTPPAYQYKNGLTGHLLIEERGIWGSVAENHVVGPLNYRTKMIVNDQNSPTTYAPVTNFQVLPSQVNIAAHPFMNGPNDLYFAALDNPASSGYQMHGTRMIFGSGYATNRAGIGFRQSTNAEDGYFVELRPSSTITNRQVHNEVTLYTRVNRVWTVLHAGIPLPIAVGVWYDIDVNLKTTGGNDFIQVFVNGLEVARANVSGALKQPNSGRMSMFARGKTFVGYEYLYGITEGAITPANGFGFFDLKYGGQRSGGWDRAQVWQLGVRYRRLFKRALVKQPYQKNVYFFDEFGPYVHEVREFDVTFDPSPVQYSQLYSSNEYTAVPVEYYSGPFGAHFTISNVARTNAILNGEDNLLYGGTDNPVDQVCVVLGRDLTIADDQIYTVKSEPMIRARGLIESDLSSQWLQSEQMAKDVGDWIVQHWGRGADELEVEVFGNPLIEIADYVCIDYTARHMSPTTHKYFVTGVNNEFDNGVSTTLTLRRIRSSVSTNV